MTFFSDCSQFRKLRTSVAILLGLTTWSNLVDATDSFVVLVVLWLAAPLVLSPGWSNRKTGKMIYEADVWVLSCLEVLEAWGIRNYSNLDAFQFRCFAFPEMQIELWWVDITMHSTVESPPHRYAMHFMYASKFKRNNASLPGYL